MTRFPIRAWPLAAVLAAALSFGAGSGSAAPTEVVQSCGGTTNAVFGSVTTGGIAAAITCPVPSDGQYGLAVQAPSTATADGARSYLSATAPAGLAIIEADVNGISAPNINGDNSYGGGFFWGPNGSDGAVANAFSNNQDYGYLQGTPGFPTQAFGFQVVCGHASCSEAGAYVYVDEVDLTVQEAAGPTLAGGGLWDASGWVRGSWPMTANGDSATGVCAVTASVDGAVVATRQFAPDPTQWHQCNAIGQGGLATTVNTAQYANGATTLRLDDLDAAGLPNTASETVQVDNQIPTMSLGGPTTASSAAGTQYVTEDVNTGPSGAYGATCSVDGGPGTFYPGASGRVPVSGLGPHTVQCVGQNNAVNASGQRASTVPATYSVDIQQPTVEGITFSNIADGLRCHTETRRVEVRGRRYVIHRDGRRIVVYSHTHRVRRRVRSCHERTVRRRVLVVLRRHGRPVRRHGHVVKVRRIQRVVLLPHRVDLDRRRIRHGRGTTVSGYLGLADGTALAGQTITIYGAPNDGDPQYGPVSSATTNADGVWVAKIPAGPSRLLEAGYAGNTIDASATSTAVKLVVPARITLSVTPRTLPWRRAITVSGQLLGGDVPPDGVALRFLVRYPGSPQRSTLLALRTNDTGGFRFKWSYHRGHGVARYPFSVATTAAETDYPFAAASSARVRVTFGRRTPRTHRRSHRHRR